MRLIVVEIVMGVASSISWLTNLEIRDLGGTVVLCASMFAIHVLVWALHLRHLAAPARSWDERGRGCSDAELLAADRAYDRLPLACALGISGAWLLYFGSVAALAWFVFPDVLAFGWLELTAMGFQFGALAVGPPVLLFPLISVTLEGAQAELGAELGRRKLEQSRTSALMAPRLVVLAVGLVMAPAFWISAIAWMSSGDGDRRLARSELRDAVRWSAHELARGEGPIDPGHRIVTADELPDTLILDGDGELGEAYVALNERYERVTAAAAVGDGRWILAYAEVQFEHQTQWIGLVSVVVALLFGAPLIVAGTARSITAPLGRLRAALRRVIHVGDLGEVGRVPVIRHDEVGELTDEFNSMLDVFEELAAAAQTVAEGDLRVEIGGKGDLQDAFRGMVARLSELVVQIRDAAIEVASAAAEIHAATRGQEEAANQQSDGIRGVSVAMERLADSAANISSAAGEVLDNAEKTRSRADEVVAKIGELGAHITRVGELLELIREIADRSDLLALNGSLEATRAGEAGRGFALVAGEMRRLAERVAQTVADVRETISDVGASNIATAAATRDSRELAEGTTAAARRIVDSTKAQSTETRSVSTGVHDIAQVVASSVAATTQTRNAADGLRQRAQQLEQLIEHFEVDDGDSSL